MVQFVSYLRHVLCKTHLIFPRINGPNILSLYSYLLTYIRLQATIGDLENKLNKQAAEYSQSTVARDLELEALRQQEEKMRLETVQIKEATDRLILCF